MYRSPDTGYRKPGGAQIAQLAQLNQVLKGVGGTLTDEPGALPGTKLFEPDAQNAEYIFTAVLGNSDVLVGGRHPHTSASLAIMRRGPLRPQAVEGKNSG